MKQSVPCVPQIVKQLLIFFWVALIQEEYDSTFIGDLTYLQLCIIRCMITFYNLWVLFKEERVNSLHLVFEFVLCGCCRSGRTNLFLRVLVGVEKRLWMKLWETLELIFSERYLS